MIRREQQDLYIRRIEHLTSRIKERIVGDHVLMSARYGHSLEPVTWNKRLDLEYKDISEGQRWGGAWDSAWFRLEAEVPSGWAGKQVVAQLDFNGEGLLFDEDGQPVQGVTNGSVFVPNSDESERAFVPLFASAEGNEHVSLWVEAAANGLFGVRKEQDPPRSCPTRHGEYEGIAQRMRLVVWHEDVWHLSLDIDVLLGLLKSLPEGSVRRERLLYGLSAMVELYADNPANTDACRKHLAPLLAQPANASAIEFCAVGHAHLDVGWLWPIREGVRKAARTFSSQLDLLDRYPDYVFGASQPQLFMFLKEHYPALYARVKIAVEAGRIEPQGAMWVEADCNIISGESMVRQVLHGKNFFRDEFGVDVKNLWIPDVFGYSASMPQIMQRAGVESFLTQKLSWSQFNRFPHTTFRWFGIDGSELLTHFPPADTYNSLLDPKGLRFAESNFQEKGQLEEAMCLFGIGDGGGGPKAEQIERGLRQRNLEGSPRVAFGRADDFFRRLHEKRDSLPIWRGELYLELHRGTLTTQGRTKRGNRKLELALRATEYICSCLPADAYPRDTLDRTWKQLLTNQFHDILPGSSIHRVYEEAERDYGAGLASCETLISEAAEALFAQDSECITLVNTLSVPVTQPVALPSGWSSGLITEGGAPVAVQTEPDGACVAAVILPPQAVVVLARAGNAVESRMETDLTLENEIVRYEFDKRGRLVSAYDKEIGRDILAGDAEGNVLTLYEDRPINYDAWDIDVFYEHQVLEHARAVNVTCLGRGPVRQGLRFELAVGVSTLTQNVTLAAGSKRLDFCTEVDWQERHRMLRVAFPVNVRSDQASFEIQYGYAKRNTHRNVSWDMAKFEVAAQRYVDLSDAQYGVALLNDCKYGHKVHENVLDLNLLRSPTHPDPDADLGSHSFTYSLLPHEGTLVDSDVMAEAAQLNQPPLVFVGLRAEASVVPVQVRGEGVGLEVLKRAEKGPDRVIRLVEKRGFRTEAVVQCRNADLRLIETDLMEWHDRRDWGAGEVTVPMAPFEIRTFRLAAARYDEDARNFEM